MVQQQQEFGCLERILLTQYTTDGCIIGSQNTTAENETRKHCPLFKTHSIVGYCMTCFIPIFYVYFIVNNEKHKQKMSQLLFRVVFFLTDISHCLNHTFTAKHGAHWQPTNPLEQGWARESRGDMVAHTTTRARATVLCHPLYLTQPQHQNIFSCSNVIPHSHAVNSKSLLSISTVQKIIHD